MRTAADVVSQLSGGSAEISALREQLCRVVRQQANASRFPPILIQGETGTGKGLVARLLHQAGARSGGPFVDINCAAIPQTLLEAEMFGFERGAFTEARHAKPGLFEAADGGTLCLDEIGLLSDELQGKLLKAIEDRVVRRLGSISTHAVDVHIIAATSEPLMEAAREGRFRQDLYHRLAVLTLYVPPLRERSIDIMPLAEQFLARYCAEYGGAAKRLAPDAAEALSRYAWPGNVRELSNVIERAVLLTDGEVINAAALALSARAEHVRPTGDVSTGSLDDAIRKRLETALAEAGGNLTQAAARLGIARNTLLARLDKYGLRPGARSAPLPRRMPLPEHNEDASPQRALRVSETTPPGLRWENRWLGLLRVELDPSARTPTSLGPSRVLGSVVEKIRGLGGRVEDVSPQGLTAAFGLEPLDDVAVRTAHAALAIQNLIGQRDDAFGAATCVKLGVHVQQALVALIGDAVQIEQAGKAQAWAVLESLICLGEVGTIHVSHAAAMHLQRRFVLIQAAAARDAPLAYRLRRREATGLELERGLAPFVGRQKELDVLEQRAREARGGALRVVDVVGDAGIGKSRLFYELRRRHDGAGCLFSHGHCTAEDRSTAFRPFLDILRSAFSVAETDSADDVRRKLSRGLEQLGIAADQALPLLLSLFGLEGGAEALRGLDAEIIGTRTREVLTALLTERCRLSPVVVILDDLQWADSASTDLLMRIIQSCSELPLLILSACRPPYQSPWSGLPGVTRLGLEPLSDDSCLELLRRYPGADGLSDEQRRKIVAKAEGNPLFAEELSRYLQRRGAGPGIHDRDVEANADVIPVPPTLRQALDARVGRVEAGARNVLELASVMGRSFREAMIASLAEVGDRDAASDLRALEECGVLVRNPASSSGEYQFKHVLIQEAVYENLSADRRELLHERVAAALERLHHGRLGEWVEILAHHYSRTPRAAKAVQYLAQAGEKSLRVWSLEEADSYFRRAVDVIERVPSCVDDEFFADTVLGWLRVYFYRSDFRGLATLVERYQSRFEKLGDPRRLSLLLFWLGFAHVAGARADQAKTVLERALALGEAAGDDRCVGWASMGLTYAYWIAPGDRTMESIDRLTQRAWEIAERLADVHLMAQTLLGFALHKAATGQYGAARQFGSRLLELGRHAGALRPTAIGLNVLAHANVFDECFDDAIEQADEAERFAPKLDELGARAAKGAALTLSGRPRAGLEVLRTARDEIVTADYLFLLLVLDIPYGVAMVLTGRLAAGVRFIEDAIARFSSWSNKFGPAFGHMVLGELYLQIALRNQRLSFGTLVRNLRFLLTRAPFAARRAERHLEEAVRLAKEGRIAATMARSLLDLGLLSQARGRRDAARVYLHEAERIAQGLGSPLLDEKIRAALTDLR